MWALITCSLAALSCVLGDPGPELWRVEAGGDHSAIQSLEDLAHIDVWHSGPHHAQVLVEPEAKSRVARALDEAQIAHSVQIPDILTLVEQEREHMESKRKRRKRAAGAMDWTSFHKLEDIEGFVGWLNATRGDIVEVRTAAISEENRRVLVVRMTDPNSTLPKKKIWIEGGIHAREWISPAVTSYLMHEVATNPDYQELLAVTEWYFVPVANPDGYEFSFSSPRARLWRKNRRNNRNPTARCKGVDLNRNWNLKWGVGASSNPCSETYKGPQAFSEPETEGLQRVMKSIDDIDVFITFHSFGQTVLYPWGWTRDAPANAKQLNRLAKKFSDAVEEKSNGQITYEIGGSGPLYGLASGATDDWAYGALGVPFSYTIELPDQGTYGFLLPENRVSNTVTETSAGVYCMVSFLTNYGRCARRRNRHPNFRGFHG